MIKEINVLHSVKKGATSLPETDSVDICVSGESHPMD